MLRKELLSEQYGGQSKRTNLNSQVISQIQKKFNSSRAHIFTSFRFISFHYTPLAQFN
jgi:hypothetical protein